MNILSEITIKAAEAAGGARYDAAAKAIFRHAEIIAPLLREVVPEYRGYSAEDIIRFIQRDSICNDAVDDVSAMIGQQNTEMNSISEKLIRYDARFKAVNPRLTTNGLVIYLHIDLEIQNDYKPVNPAYPVIKRGIYYAAREISSQLGILTEKTDYGALEKIYSIWICSDKIPLEERNTISVYRFGKDDLVGTVKEPEENYDLMDVIVIRRGSDAQDDVEPVFDYLNGIFSSNVDKVNQYVNISNKPEVLEGVSRMSGLGESIYIRGMQQGIQQGMQQGMQKGLDMIASLVRDGLLDIKEAARRADMSEEELTEFMNSKK